MIYFRGCMSRERVKKISDATEELLKRAKVDYRILDNEGCCGSVLLRTGFQEDALEIIKETFKNLKGEKVLVSCAGCYRTFKEDYPEVLGETLDVIHTSHLFLELIKQEKLRLSMDEEEVTYHDPCHMGRHMGEYKTPRQIIRAYAKLVEMERNQEKARCCGAGGGVRSAFPELSSEIARMRMDDAKSTGAQSLVTCCPFCVHNLESVQEGYIKSSDTVAEDKQGSMNIMDLSQFLLERIKVEED
jgi:Fe-S oxidoreductase